MAGNTQTNQIELGNESLKSDSSLAQRALDSVRNTAKVSVAALGITAAASAALAQEQRIYDYTQVISTESGESCETPNPELSYGELQECFGLDFVSIQDEDLKGLVAGLWQSYSDKQKSRAIALFAGGLTAMEAIATVTDNDNRSSDIVRMIHSRAIELGRGEYIDAMITRDPLFTEGRGVSLSNEDKIIRASRYYDNIISDFLSGNDNDSLEQFVDYAPSFANYVSEFPDDFPLATRLLQEMRISELEANIAESEANIAESEANIAESEANIAESDKRIAALQRLQRALGGDV